MKRYLLFAGLNYYPSMAWVDFKGRFDSIEEAIEEVKGYRAKGYRDIDWYQIVDLNEDKVVKEGNILNTFVDK